MFGPRTMSLVALAAGLLSCRPSTVVHSSNWQLQQPIWHYQGAEGRLYLDRSVETVFPKTAPKRLYVLEGTPYEMGVLTGELAGEDLTNSVQAVKELLRADLPCGTICAEILFRYLEEVTVQAWDDQVAKQHIPKWYVEEMNGMLAGAQLKAKAAGQESGVTREDLILPNYIGEVAMGLALSGKFLPSLQAWAEPRGHSPHLAQLRDEDLAGLWRLIVPMCDGYAAKDKALLSGKGVLLARSLQAGGTTWAEGVGYVLRKPVCAGRPCSVTYQGYTSDLLPTLSIGGLGQVGALTVMNSQGFGTGTQTLRSSAVSITEIGIGSALLNRYTADVGGSTQAALAAAARAVRGIPYIQIMGDAGGDIEVAEMVRSEQSGPLGNPYDSLQDNSPEQTRKLEKLIPRDHFSGRFPPHGVFGRRPDYVDPEWLPSLDASLSQAQGWKIEPERFSRANGMIWDHYWEEWRLGQILVGPYLFSPARRWPDRSRTENRIVSTNFPINPEISLSCMTQHAWSSGIESEASHWRFDTLNRRLYDQYGKITVEAWEGNAEEGTGMQYISPWAVPGYPLNRKETKPLPRSEYGKVHISGSLAIMDLPNLTLYSKFGYWGDGWTKVNLRDWLEAKDR